MASNEQKGREWVTANVHESVERRELRSGDSVERSASSEPIFESLGDRPYPQGEEHWV